MEQKPFIVNGAVHRTGQQAVQGKCFSHMILSLFRNEWKKTRKVQKLQLIQPNAMPVTSTGATLNGQPVTLLQV